MHNSAVQFAFQKAVEELVCSGYTLVSRYVALKGANNDEPQLWAASLEAHPGAPRPDFEFQIEVEDAIIGQKEVSYERTEDLLSVLKAASFGTLRLGEAEAFRLAGSTERDVPVQSHLMADPAAWYMPVRYEVRVANNGTLPTQNRFLLDAGLRLAHPPFDGIDDVAIWLGLKVAGTVEPTFSIFVLLPVDIKLDESRPSNNRLELTVEAHAGLNPSAVAIAIREAPGGGAATPRAVGTLLEWREVDNRRIGTAAIQLVNAKSVLAMLVVGKHTVRRH